MRKLIIILLITILFNSGCAGLLFMRYNEMPIEVKYQIFSDSNQPIEIKYEYVKETQAFEHGKSETIVEKVKTPWSKKFKTHRPFFAFVSATAKDNSKIKASIFINNEQFESDIKYQSVTVKHFIPFSK
jgi:hypothetical protein